MTDNISDKSTADLLGKLGRGGKVAFRYEMENCLLARWRREIDLDHLVDLLRSRSSSDRLRGAYYLGELGQAVEGLKTPALLLADDSLSDCRRAFVSFIWNSCFYDPAIANALAKCLLDLDLYVRLTTIRWAIRASEEIFADFSRLVGSGAGQRKPNFRNPLSNDFWNAANQKRAVRGLEIARRVREGDKPGQIKEDLSEEDSFVFDGILFSMTTRERYSKRRKIKSHD